jgi:hypothetical protein
MQALLCCAQVLLAYGLMVQRGCEMTLQEVDAGCEHWLLDRFKLEVSSGVGV